MKPLRTRTQAFTLVEIIVTAAVTGIVAMGILTYASMAVRMVARNVAVNHGHDVARASLERLLSDLHDSASQFTLFNVTTSGTTTTYTDVSPTFTSSSDTDAYYVNYLINNNRANGVRFYRPAGTGPYQLTGDGVVNNGTIQPTSTTLEFDFKGSGYVPSTGDLLQMPLIYSGEYQVVGTATNTSGTKYKVTLSQATGYYLYTGTVTTNTSISYGTSNPANTAGYFYQRVAYSVLNNQLRFHPNFTDPGASYPATWNAAATDIPIVVRNNVASVAPFSLLVSGTAASTSGIYTLRVSLVAYDLNYSSKTFMNGATTLLSIIPPRTVTDQNTILSDNTRLMHLKPITQSRSASTLMAVLVLICTMTLIMGAVFMATTGEARLMKRNLDRYTAIAYGDGVVESLFDQWRAAMTSSTNLSQTQKRYGPTGAELKASPFSVAAPSTTVLPVPSGMSLSSWNITAGTPYNGILSGTVRPTLENGTNSSLLIRMYYVATATVNFPNGQVTVQRIFTRAGTNIFNNFLYSAQPVTELNPGQAMYVNGTIYAGGNLYMDSPNLNLLQDVSYTGSNSISLAPGDNHGTTTGTPSWPASDPPHLGTSQNLIDVVTSELDANFVSAGSYYDPGVYSSTNSITQDINNKGYHELIEQQKTPLSTNPDPLALDTNGDSERLANNADYTITVDSSNNINIYSGTSTTPLTPSSSGTSAYNAIAKALITNTAFYDGRMGDTVRALTVDVGQITTAYNSGIIQDNNVYEGQQAKDGLLIYIVDTSAANATITSSAATISGTNVTTNGYGYSIVASGANGLRTTGTNSSSSHVTSTFARGIRLVNGGKLPTGQSTGNNTTGGLTIASPNPVYIQGDFNTGSTMSGSFSSNGVTITNQPSSNGSSAYPSGTSAPSPVSTVSGTTYQRQAAVIAADAVTILSNGWGDSSSNASLSSRAPDNTTVNTAIVSGNVPTAFVASHFSNSTVYSGGIENFPRLLESWNGSGAGGYLTIYGSFAMLYNSLQAIQPWQGTGNYYNAPGRRWFFDSTLQNYNPPGFPAAYTYSRGQWSTQ